MDETRFLPVFGKEAEVGAGIVPETGSGKEREGR